MTTQTVNDTLTQVVAAQATDNGDKFLTFCLGAEEYGVEILRVREIIGLIDITALPRTPDFVKGVINLRGKIIPVIELRSKFGLPEVEYTDATCVIVVEVTDSESDGQFQMGVIVDTVSEVLDIPGACIETAPKLGCAVGADYILGMGKVATSAGDKVVILLDIDRVLTGAETKPLMQVEGAQLDDAPAPSGGAHITKQAA